MQICMPVATARPIAAVFPAMTRRLTFDAASAHYLANLCHSCGACLHSCQYAPPHEFAVNVPRAMAEVRRSTYEQYAWPQPLGALYRHNGLVPGVGLCGRDRAVSSPQPCDARTAVGSAIQANFYAIFPHNTLVLMFGATSAGRCWHWPSEYRDSGGTRHRAPSRARR